MFAKEKWSCSEQFHSQSRQRPRATSRWVKSAILLIALFGLLLTTHAKSLEDDELGKIIPPPSTDPKPAENPQDGQAGEIPKDYEPVLPFTESQQRKKKEMEAYYGEDKELGFLIDSIEPNAGPTTGDTRVLVRGGPFEDLDLLYPQPKCRFGQNDRVVSATYVKCSDKPISMDEAEGKNKAKKNWCLQCENSPAVDKAQITTLMISLKGDFSDSQDSEPYRYYNPTVVDAIYPRYGPKDGGTLVQVWGKNFLNYGDDFRCNFGSKSVLAQFKSSTYLTCKSPFSDVTNKPITFSISLNKQQNSKELIDFWYYQTPQVSKLNPNFGPDSGGNRIEIHGSNLHPFIDEKNIDNRNDSFCVFWDLKGKKMPMTLISATKSSCEVPPALEGVSVTGVDVTINNQDYSDDDAPYYFYKPPKVYNMIPKEGPTKGGTDVRIFAPEFKRNKKIVCIFGETRTHGKHISKTEVECISPPHQPPEQVMVSVMYEEDGEPSRSNPLPFLYYETPEVWSVEPPCGPTYGRTQVKVKGKNFIDLGFGRAYCVFNGTRWMNTTIIDKNTILCQTPPLTRYETLLTQQDMVYQLRITLNEKDLTPTYAQFNYYHEPEIQNVLNSPQGPISGSTKSTLVGRNFNQRNICNLKVRYGALEVTPKRFNDTHLQTTSPRVSAPGAVVLAAAGNAQNYAKDYIYHFRDTENTFTYYQDMFVHDLHPQSGPTTGKTKLDVQGIGFNQFKYENGTRKDDTPLYVKFVDSVTGNQIGNVTEINNIENDGFQWQTPPAKDGTKAILELSLNKQNWQSVIPTEKEYSYLYYNAPVVKEVDPHYGPVKSPNDEKAIIIGENFICPKDDCSKCLVRFGDSDFGTVVPGKVLSSSQIEVYVPKYTKPDILPVEVSMNGRDFTNDHATYGFFDAFLLDVHPRLIVKKGGTRLRFKGFGFVNSESGQLKAKFLSTNGQDFVCNGNKPCSVPATFQDKGTMFAETLPQSVVKYQDGQNVSEDALIPEISVYGDSYTDNELEVYYIYDPEYLELNKRSVPKNFQIPLVIKTEFYWDKNVPERFFKYANFTCKFTTESEVMVTQARMESMPLGAGYRSDGKASLPSHIICPSPKMDRKGPAKLQISANGQDYTSEGFAFEFTEEVDTYRVAPQSGPKQTESKVKLIGGGFKQATDEVYAKFGTFDLEPIAKEQIINKLWSQEEYLSSMLMGKDDLRTFRLVQTRLEQGETVQTVWSKSPQAPHASKTPGGPVFVTAGQVIELDVVAGTRRMLDGEPTLSTPTPSNATEPSTQPEAKNETTPVANNSTPTTQNEKKEAAPVQQDLVKELTTPIHTHSNAKAVAAKPGDRYIFTESPVEFYYYHEPVVKKVQPTAGLSSGGTPIEISGAWFNEKLEYGVVPYCMIGDKIVRARFYSTVRIVCHSPPNDNLALALPVKVSLNGVDFVDSGYKFSYYVQPELLSVSPQSGPMTGGTDIFITANQFSNITDVENVKCRFTLKDNERVARPKYMSVTYINETTMKCMSPNGFKGGEKVLIQMTFNDQDYTTAKDDIAFRYYVIFGSFPKSGPADSFGETILIKGAGLTSNENVMCHLNGTAIKPVSISDNIIQCPMVLPDKDPSAIGPVKFALKFAGNWNEFGNFYYYNQISFETMTPNFGPSEGEGEIKMTGDNFRNDFHGVEIGCKVGESIGKGIMTDENTIKCVVEELELVNEDEALVVGIALNSYSWVSNQTNPHLYRPYGIQQMQPSSGPYDGFTDIMVIGKGFMDENGNSGSPRCKFGVDGNFAIIDAQVIDYNRINCRSPEQFALPENADQVISVPFGIALGEDENKPWTMGTWRFRFYTQPSIQSAYPEEVRIGRFAEIYLYAYEDERFIEPLPSGKNGDTTGIICNFEDFGNSMGMYINETTLLCVTPHIKGRPEDFYRETVQVTIAMNGQDFNEVQSDAYVTFVGTGSDYSIIYFLIMIILLALLILALISLCLAFMRYFLMKGERKSIQANTLALRESSTGSVQRGSLENARYQLGGPSRQGSGSRNSRTGSVGSRRRF